MRFKIISEEALMGGWNHTLVDTTKEPTHRLYERGVAWSRYESHPQSLLHLQMQLATQSTAKVRRYAA